MAGVTKWWSKETVAVVTGANAGIGFEIVRQLASKGLTTVLTARDEGRGREAVAKLKHEGLDVAFHPLDVHSEDSARHLAQWIGQTYGGLDILVNNAGIALRAINPENVDLTLQTNYFGVKRVTKALLPQFRHSLAGARIVINTSRVGLLKYLNNKYVEEFSDRDGLTEEKIDNFVNTYADQVKNGTWEKGGWPDRNTTYSISKVATNAYISVLDQELSQRPEGQKIYVNSFCPGFTKTNLTEGKGSEDIVGSVQTCLWLALMGPGGPSGKFWAEQKEVGWH